MDSALVCIVDDDPSVRRALKRLIRSVGLAVEVCGSADEYLSRDKDRVVDCLILDIRMPGLSGLDLQQRLDTAGSSTPIIFITAHDDEESRVRALTHGALAYFEKPFDDEELLEKVFEAIGQRPPSTV